MPYERKAHWMNEEPTPEKDTKSPSKSCDDATRKAGEASEAKAEELRTNVAKQRRAGQEQLGLSAS